MKINLDFNMPIVCLTYYGRSGSFLLQGLLNNHPNIISTPSHALIQVYDYCLRSLPKQDAKDLISIVNDFTANFPYLFIETDQSVPLRLVAQLTTIGVPRVKFSTILHSILSHTVPRHVEPSIFIRAVHFAYDLALGRNVDEAKLIVWQKHTPFFGESDKAQFVKLLGNVRFLVAVRRPDVTLSSHFNYKNYQDDKKSNIREPNDLINFMNASGRVHSEFDSISRVVKFEDIHGKTEPVTQALANWFRIEWHPTMLEPTVDGKEQLFPKNFGVVRGLNRNIENTQKSPHLNWFDKLNFAAVNHEAYKKWEYPTAVSSVRLNNLIAKIGLYIPLKMEYEKFRLDLKETKDLFLSVSRAKKRRRNIAKSLKALKGLNDSNFKGLKLVDLLY